MGKNSDQSRIITSAKLLVMRSIIFLILVIGLAPLATTGKTLSPSRQAAIFDHLVTVNREWTQHAEKAPEEQMSFTTDAERIQLHLNLVTESLLQKDISHLDQYQSQNRKHLLDTLRHYAERSLFPTNTFHVARRPYFIDVRGVHCAVGYLMKASGYGALAKRISATENYEYLADISTPGVDDWAKFHGFTLDELAWIQPNYGNALALKDVGGGTNGEVIRMQPYAQRYPDLQLVVAGQYTEVGEIPCNGIASYSNGDWTCLDLIFEGEILDFHIFYDSMVVLGDFQYQNKQYAVAAYSFKTNSWHMKKNPRDTPMIATNFYGLNGLLLIAYKYKNASVGELWRFDLVDNRMKDSCILKTNGIINDIILDNGWVNSDQGLYVGGGFSKVQLTHDSVNHDAWNIARVRTTHLLDSFEMDSMITLTSDTVQAFVENINAFYVLSVCGHGKSEFYSDACISRLYGNILIPIFSPSVSSSFSNCPCTVKDMISAGDYSIVGGDFEISNQFDSRSIARFNGNRETLENFGSLEGKINHFVYFQNELIIAGKFQTKEGIRNIARMVDGNIHTSTLPHIENPITIYPNPAQHAVRIDDLQKSGQIEVISASGSVVYQTQYQEDENYLEFEIDHLSPGVYLAKCTTVHGQVWLNKLVISR